MCRIEPPPWERIHFHGAYDDLLREMVLRLKFAGGIQMAAPLRVLLRQSLRGEGPLPELVVPVPLHPERLRWRGFNQSLLLARAVAADHKGMLAPKALRRIRATRPQSELGPGERRRNLSGAFAAGAETVRGRSVLLVDDVLTTGTTMRECARVLRRAGASRVEALVPAVADASDQPHKK